VARDLRTPDDVYRALGRRLGGQPDPVVWRLLESDRWPEDVVEDGETLDELEKKYEERLAILEEGGRRPRPMRQTGAPISDTGAWSWALSEIMALEAANEPVVRAFRKLVLGDELVPEAEASTWMISRSQAAQQFEVVSRPDLPASPMGPRVSPWESQLAVEDYVNGKAAPLPTRADYEIDFLYCLADVLQSWYGWSLGTSVHEFILSGKVPRLNAIQASIYSRQRFYPGSSTIVMLVSPRCPPRRVMEIYSMMRKAYPSLAQRIRPPQEKELALAVFIAKHNDGRSWSEALRAWKESSPIVSYGDVRSFARDARKAYRRVVGSAIEWQGGQAEERKP
jgi:hypothetical protein